MPVRLDQIPALAPRPARPGRWLWLGVIPVLLLLLGVCGTFLFGTQALRQQPLSFWGLALGVPLLGWCLMSFGRVLLYFGQQQVADGWDQAREEDLSRKLRRGRRVSAGVGRQSAYGPARGRGAVNNTTQCVARRGKGAQGANVQTGAIYVAS